MKNLAITLVCVAVVVFAIYFEWWRCGEMFPHGQLACFLNGR